MLLRRISVLAVLLLAVAGTAAEAVPARESERTVAQSVGKPNRNSGGRPDRAQGGSGQRGGGQQRWIEQLNLTPQQQQEIQAIRDRYEQDMQAKKEQMNQAMSELRQMMAGNASDRDLRNKHNEVVRLRQQMGEMRFEQMLAMRNVLTPEQRQQFNQLMEEGRQNRGNRGGNQSGNRGGQNRPARGNGSFLEDDDF